MPLLTSRARAGARELREGPCVLTKCVFFPTATDRSLPRLPAAFHSIHVSMFQLLHQ